MSAKLKDYQGTVGQLHELRGRFTEWREGVREWGQELRRRTPDEEHADDGENATTSVVDNDYSHIYRRKTRRELVRISAAVMGIEFSYAAETAFVSPTLLKIGVKHRLMTMVWGLSPLIGFFLTPLLGSLSDRCPLQLGRRRPFILLLSTGVFLGLLLVPNGERLGYSMGDSHGMKLNGTDLIPVDENENGTSQVSMTGSHPWGVFFTILGTVLLDFDADACQSPARAYLLDVTQVEDHARGLSTFTIMAGLGGCMGYALGGINWDNTSLGMMLGGHVRAVFSLITVIFVICVTLTVTSFREIPLARLGTDYTTIQQNRRNSPVKAAESTFITTSSITQESHTNYGTTESEGLKAHMTHSEEEISTAGLPTQKIMHSSSDGYVNYGFEELEMPAVSEISLRQYLLSIVHMPKSLRILCATNFFCWCSHVCYSLYFTDFVGEAVFGGNPQFPEGSEERDLYEEGVRFGCWGMAMYSLSCAGYSLIIERLVQFFGAKRVYVCGQLTYCLGMSLLACSRHRAGVIIFSGTAGVMYSTLFTMPYLLVARYHALNKFSDSEDSPSNHQVRGLGTDVAIISSMVFLAQFNLSLCMGSIVSWFGTTTAVVCVAALLSFCGAICALRVLYLDL